MTDREKIMKAFAPLHASDTAVQEVLEMTEKKTHTMKRSGRVVLLAAVVAVLLIGTALAAYSTWSRGLQDRLHVTDEQAAMLEGTAIVSHPAVSDTHDGVTVSIEQAVISGNTAHLALRIDGLEIPEGDTLAWGEPSVTVDGERPSGWGFGVYEDLHWDGKRFAYGDGTIAPLAEEGFPMPRVVREDGSVELDVSLNTLGQMDSLIGKKITVTLYRLGTTRLTTGRSAPEYTAEGPWVLTWTAEGTENGRTWTLDEPMGHGVTLTKVTLSTLSAHIEYEYPPLTVAGEQAYDADGNELPEEPPFLYRIVMKDGTEYAGVLGAGTAGPDVDDASELENGFVYAVDMELTRIIDPDEVASLVFHEIAYGDVPASEMPLYTVRLSD